MCLASYAVVFTSFVAISAAAAAADDAADLFALHRCQLICVVKEAHLGLP